MDYLYYSGVICCIFLGEEQWLSNAPTTTTMKNHMDNNVWSWFGISLCFFLGIFLTIGMILFYKYKKQQQQQQQNYYHEEDYEFRIEEEDIDNDIIDCYADRVSMLEEQEFDMAKSSQTTNSRIQHAVTGKKAIEYSTNFIIRPSRGNNINNTNKKEEPSCNDGNNGDNIMNTYNHNNDGYSHNQNNEYNSPNLDMNEDESECNNHILDKSNDENECNNSNLGKNYKENECGRPKLDKNDDETMPSMISSPEKRPQKTIITPRKRRRRRRTPRASEVALPTLESLAYRLAQCQFENIVVVMGAGASVSAGIPDFRTPGTGLYDSLSKYNLPFPEAIFDLEYYTTVNAQPFVDLSSNLLPGQIDGPRPTITHAFLKVLQDRGILRRVYTQNIDGLEVFAGVNSDKLVECHGDFRSASCTKCRTKADIEGCMQTMLNKQIPTCGECGGLVKPDIVFFGEDLPNRFERFVDDDTEDCDLLIVIGTSLSVMPVAGIPQWVSRTCPRLLLNREKVGNFGHVQRTSTKEGGEAFYTRDVIVQGDCDDGVQQLCHLLGWNDALEEAYSFASKRHFRDQL